MLKQSKVPYNMNNAVLLLLFALASCVQCQEAAETVIEEILPESNSATVRLVYKKPNIITKVEIALNNRLIDTFKFTTSNYNIFFKPHIIILPDLEPCTEYNLTIRTSSFTFKQIATDNKQLFTTTCLNLPPESYFKYDADNDLLKWMGPRTGPTSILGYYVFYEKTTYLVSNLEPYSLADLPGCLNVELNIIPEIDKDVYGQQFAMHITTRYKEPNGMGNFDVHSVSPTRIVVSWNVPNKNPQCVGYYTIQYNGQVKYSTITSFTITDLEPCEMYNITMCIVTKLNSYVQCIERTETTKYKIPELLNSKVIAGSTFANLFLEYKHLKCIQKIQFSLNDGIRWNNWTESLTITQQYYVDFLKPCTKYSLFMEPFFNSSFGKLTSELFKTQPVKIDPVENIKFNQETDLLTWDRPSFGEQCINRYIVNYINYSEEDTVSFEWLMISNLAGCSNFQIQITPMGQDDLKGKSKIENIETGFKEPDPVKIVHADSSSPNSITVIWDRPTRNPNCAKNFTILYSTEIIHTTLTKHTIYNLEPCTRYTILICIGIIQSPTDGCTKQEITTQPTLPEVTIASIISKPFSGVVSLEYKNRNCFEKIEIELPNRSELFNKSSLPDVYRVEKLRPCTRYNLIVKATSLHSTKIVSANKTFETKYVAIEAVRNVKFYEKVGLLTWKRPHIGSECIKNYIINDGINNATWSQEYYDLSYLPGCQNFDVEITSMGENGELGMGYTLKLETALKAPGAVKISSINSNSPNSISIDYTRPTLNPKCVRNYAILYNGKTQHTNQLSYNIKNLEACTEYNIIICIVTINNETGSCTLQTQNITTKPDLPETTIGTIIPGPTFVDIPLEYKNMKCIKNIQIGIINGNTTVFNSSNLPMNYRVGLLNPCTNFILYVKTVSDDYVQKISTNKTFKTKPVKIHSVQDIKFDEKTNLLTWLRPSVGEECLEHYALDDGLRKVNITYEFYNLTHLPGCSNFSIQITPVGGLGASGMPNVLEIQTGMKEPDSVEIEFAGISSPSQITINWTIPPKNPNCVKHYAIVYNENTEYTTNSTTHTMQNLEPCTKHNIQICIITINNKRGLCTTNSENITTESAAPEITINSIITESFSANVSLAYKNPSCIWYFEIILNNTVLDLYEKFDLKKFYVVNQLKPCSEYHLVIKIHHSLHTNQSFYTNKTFITKSVRNIPKIDHIEFNENSDLLKWKRPDFGAECVKRYSVDSNGITNITTTESLNLAYLPGCTKYEIGITPEGDNDLVGETLKMSIETGFKQPDHITNLYASFTNPRSISMVWNAPYKNLNCVSQYEIKYEHNTEFTNVTQYTIENLKPCLEYNIQICIFMKNNETGMCTEGYIVNTTIAISSGIQQLRYTNSVIEWESPSYGAECVQKYVMMMYDELGRQIISEKVIARNFTLDRMKIKSCKHYTVSIIPVNFDNGLGDAEQLTFKTEPIKPEAPSAPKILSKTATSLVLESDYENDRDQCPLQSAIFTCITDDVSKFSSTIVSFTQNERKFSATIHDLKDLTNYTCTVRIDNAAYSSDQSRASKFETNEKLSDPPDFRISSIQSKSLSIAWKAPNNKKLRLKSYQVRIMKIGKNYAIPVGCQILHYNETFVIEPDKLKYTVSNLEPFTIYSVQMAIENTAGIGDYSPIGVVTGPDSPHQMNNFRVHRLNYDHTAELKWDLPCEINGEIIAIKGTFYESLPTNTSVISFEWKLKSSNDLTQVNFYKSKPIKPEHIYNITIGIELQNFTGPLNETSILYTSPPGIPAAYVSSNWGLISQTTTRRDHVKLTINKNIFNAINGKIREFTFLISERNCQEDPRPNYYFYKNNVDQPLPSWFDFKDDECTGQYQIQKFPNDYNIDEDGSFEFIIGNETCDNTKRYSGYCNGPLKSETDYALIARVFTSVGYADTNPIFFTTENNFPTLIIMIGLCIIIALVIGLGFVWFKWKISVNRKPPTLIVADKGEIATKSTTTHKYSHLLKYDPDDAADEYDLINALDSRNLTTVVAQENHGKNRYANILPYDHNRVYVTPNTYCSTDYINASYINGCVRPNEYIASQGPTDDTCYDFWNMIIEKNCHQIIMLAKLVENRMPKCAQYYPDPNADLKFNNICVTNVRQLDLDLCTRRDIKITKATVEHSVVQYHFQTWPDHGCPKNELDLIKFIEFVRSDYQSCALNIPIVVHCSAGVGRTGTLIALDILLQQIENNQDCNVYETVKNLRYQRMKMVQTLVQYEFVYKCVARYLHQK